MPAAPGWRAKPPASQVPRPVSPFAELNLDFVAVACLSVLQQQVEATGVRMDSFLVFQNHVPQAQQRRVLRNPFLNPSLIEFRIPSK
jgi:hypothetical protein